MLNGEVMTNTENSNIFWIVLHFQSKAPAGDTFHIHMDFIIIMIFLFYVQWAKEEFSKTFYQKVHFPPKIFI